MKHKDKEKDMIEYGNMENDIWVEEISITYVQKPDCCQTDDNFQHITLTSVDNGVSPFIRMSIPEGEFWSIDGNKNDLESLIEDFNKKMNFKEQ